MTLGGGTAMEVDKEKAETGVTIIIFLFCIPVVSLLCFAVLAPTHVDNFIERRRRLRSILSVLEPVLTRHGLEWPDVEPLLETVDGPDEIANAIANPEAFFNDLITQSQSLGTKLMLNKLKPKLEPH